ncbi:hypothetical protein HN807_11185 [Candidatus Bathyarchaeota archaeon]|nr:hypothetical protein [Candidatus Bathyarchaeota archaeon]MBT4320875.1 hypothetical protein [Candidatus Bathyarchaeota archaeon]MBT4423148.1 hypothetical protein [Candidatus Bathyarchaeota archaeon]MBT5642108.1 hypothetical protein [Candidatus Bathyarchaeota archaeon]MBT6605989.1 hypothetical protein [Candidatus Bathyarchaeota archaeon]
MSKGCCGDNLPSPTLGETGTICYCNHITAQEIVKTVKETGVTTISGIKEHLRNEVISNCSEFNPTGECCHKSFDAVIKHAMVRQ